MKRQILLESIHLFKALMAYYGSGPIKELAIQAQTKSR